MSGWRQAAAALLSEPVTWDDADAAPNLATDKTAITATTPPAVALSGASVGFGGSVIGRECENGPAAALVRLAASPPPGVSPSTWASRFLAAAVFEAAWGNKARALGWTDADLYGLHPHAPLIRLDGMGAAFLCREAAVVAVTAEAVVFSVPPNGLRQSARKPTLAVPPAWEMYP